MFVRISCLPMNENYGIIAASDYYRSQSPNACEQALGSLLYGILITILRVNESIRRLRRERET